jgi:hypothetical protein
MAAEAESEKEDEPEDEPDSEIPDSHPGKSEPFEEAETGEAPATESETKSPEEQEFRGYQSSWKTRPIEDFFEILIITSSSPEKLRLSRPKIEEAANLLFNDRDYFIRKTLLTFAWKLGIKSPRPGDNDGRLEMFSPEVAVWTQDLGVDEADYEFSSEIPAAPERVVQVDSVVRVGSYIAGAVSILSLAATLLSKVIIIQPFVALFTLIASIGFYCMTLVPHEHTD